MRYLLIAFLIFSPSLFFHSRQVFLLFPVEIFFYALFIEYLEKKSRILFVALNISFLLFSLLFSTYGILTGVEVGYQVLTSTFETNRFEIIEFINSPFFIKYILIYLLLFSLGVYLILNKTNSSKKISNFRYTPALTVVFIAVFVFHTYKEFNAYPQNVFQMLYKYFFTMKKSIDTFNSQNYHFKGDINSSKQTNIILVIGEASRKASYSLYGYERETNPLLKNKELILFKDAVSSSRATRISVPSMLSLAPIQKLKTMFEYPTMIKVFNDINYTTYTISNQTVHLSYDVFIDVVLGDSQHKTYLELEKNNKYFDKKIYDIELLPYIKKAVEDNSGKKFIIVHLAGSHYRYDFRYPKQFNIFKNGKQKDFYDNSIVQTDFVLAKIKEMIDLEKKPYLLFYASDHGEYVGDFGDDVYGHGIKPTPTKFETQIPFIFSYNKAFKNSHKEQITLLKSKTDKKVSLDNVSHTILSLCGIYPKEYDKSYDLSSKSFIEHQRYFTVYSMKDVKSYEEIMHVKK